MNESIVNTSRSVKNQKNVNIEYIINYFLFLHNNYIMLTLITQYLLILKNNNVSLDVIQYNFRDLHLDYAPIYVAE